MDTEQPEQTQKFSLSRWNGLVNEAFDEVRKLSSLKGGEYSGDTDRLANFRRNALDQDLPMATIWRIYAAKHWDAIGQFIRDEQKGVERLRLESIEGRIDDLIVYLLLFKAMQWEKAGKGKIYEGAYKIQPRPTTGPVEDDEIPF